MPLPDTPPSTPKPRKEICNFCGKVLVNAYCYSCQTAMPLHSKKEIVLPPPEHEKWVQAGCCLQFIKFDIQVTEFYCCSERKKLYIDGAILPSFRKKEFPIYASRTFGEIRRNSELYHLMKNIDTYGPDRCDQFGILNRCHKLIRQKTSTLKRKAKGQKQSNDFCKEVEAHDKMRSYVKMAKKVADSE